MAEALIVDPTPIQPLWQRFGREYIDPLTGQKLTEWFPYDPDTQRPPSANVYQENYAPLDAGAMYARKRQFPPDTTVWTSEPFSGEQWSKNEFSPKCPLSELQFLPTWHKVTVVQQPPPAP